GIASRIAARFDEASADGAHLFGKLRGRARASSDEAVTVAHRPTQGIGMARAKPDRRMRLLKRLGPHGGVVQLPEATTEGCPGLGPECLHDAQAFRKPRHAR